MNIETGNDLAAAVKARTVRTDATLYADGGFAGKAIETASEMVNFPVEALTYKRERLMMTGRHIWAYAGVGRCYEMLNADGSLYGWFSTGYVKPLAKVKRVKAVA